MELIRNFTGLNKGDAGLAGGKGASLGEMTQAGIPVPLGFVVLAGSFEQFLKETDLNVEIDSILNSVNHKEIHTVEFASEKIQGLILAVKMPEDIEIEIKKEFKLLSTKYVAVRSSATAEDGQDHAWAGQLDSYLNTTEADLLNKVQRCWASLFTPRAIFYRFEKGLDTTKISVAVVVQKMVESEISGIAFSVHPVTQDYNQLIIEAGCGLGEAIVSGQITPDSYVVEKQPRNISDINISEQERGLYKIEGGGNEWKDIPTSEGARQKLSGKQILELSEIILGIENHYGFPCDIEWAYEKEKFYIVQSRPITTLTQKTEENKKKGESVWQKTVERKQSVYIMTLSLRIYNQQLKEISGFGYSQTLCINQHGMGTLYRDAQEIEQSKQHFLNIIKNDPTKIREWYTIAQQKLDEAQALIKEVKTPGYTFRPFEEFEPKFIEIFSYSTIFVFMILEAINSAIEKGEKDYYEEAKELFEKLRSQTAYPQLMSEIFPHYFSLVAKKNKLTEAEAQLLDANEFEDVLNGKKVDITDLEKRDAFAAFLFNPEDKSYQLSTNESDYAQILETHNKDVKEITGQIAFKGKAQGKVRIINVAADMKGFEEGDILVSINTSPTLMPAIMKAAAIITDEGGIMCHASIISRELKKPCIIGTKNATKVLKDGDIVEVDADNGVVKIIK